MDNKYKLSHARHDTTHCLAPGLFRALKDGERKKAKLDITYDFGNGNRIEFSGPEPLGADDLRVLQGLIAMAGPDGVKLGSMPESEIGKALRQKLELTGDAISEAAIKIEGSYKELAKEIGYKSCGGKQLQSIRKCIERLWKVSVIFQSGKKRMGFHLLSDGYKSDDNTGHMCIALNPLLAQTIMGGGKHVRINMAEVRAIKSENVRLIHQRLCGWIDPGKSRTVSIDTICSYIWPLEAKGSAMRMRRQRARDALNELAAINWSVKETKENSGQYIISRPSEQIKLPAA